jgi:phosphatidate cytidylyltransferase
MTPWERLFDATLAFDHPVTQWAIAGIAVALITASIFIRLIKRTGQISDGTFSELLNRTRSWYVLAAVLALPILLGAFWVCSFFFLLSLFCFREYARAAGMYFSWSLTLSVGAATTLTYFAALDHWMGLFTTSWVLGVYLISIAGLFPDQPEGYLRRTSLAILGYALFGISLAHLAFLANNPNYRQILLWILLCTGLNDVFAYLCGRTLGRRKLMPRTSPNKTWAGALGAVALTSFLSMGIAYYVFRESTLDRWLHLLSLGLLISVLGQIGDLIVSAIKRDLAIKDMGSLLPGHGGLLDRFDSLLLVAPVVFHYLNYFMADGIGEAQPTRILSRQWLN